MTYWVEATLPEDFCKEAKEWCDGYNGVRVKCNHFTLIYDIGAENISWVESMLESVGSVNVRLGEIRLGDVSPVMFCEIISEEIQKLFQNIYIKTNNSSQVIVDGKYTPHMTLFWFDVGDKERFANIVPHISTKFSGKRVQLSDWKIRYTPHRATKN